MVSKQKKKSVFLSICTAFSLPCPRWPCHSQTVPTIQMGKNMVWTCNSEVSWDTLPLQCQRNCLQACALVPGCPVSVASSVSKNSWGRSNIFSFPFSSELLVNSFCWWVLWLFPSVLVLHSHSLNNTFLLVLPWKSPPHRHLHVQQILLKFSGSEQERLENRSLQ